LELAREHPELTVNAKTKGITRQDTELFQMLDSATLPPNFKIVSGGDPTDLIAESRVVIGFNTSGLLEALALGKPVIVPRFGEARDPVLENFVIDLGDSVQYADSPEHIRDLICASIRRPLTIPRELSPAVKAILRHWVGNDDGRAGQRAYEAICKEVIRK
jgi:glycosyltransferase involved in cell wall biosynthesis